MASLRGTNPPGSLLAEIMCKIRRSARDASRREFYSEGIDFKILKIICKISVDKINIGGGVGGYTVFNGQ
jgi:hypothetical protein